MTPRIDRETVRDRSDRSVWRLYRKTRATEMLWTRGPAEVVTREGVYALPVGWMGYIAVDSEGYPYPIELRKHAATYMTTLEEDA